MKAKNLEMLNVDIKTAKKPFIIYDVETTGIMNGNDNRITEIALASYTYNKDTSQYELEDKIFMLAKPDINNLNAIRRAERTTDENITKKLQAEYLYSLYKGKYASYTKDEVLDNSDKFLNTEECDEYVNDPERRGAMRLSMDTATKVDDVLKLQGIDINTYMNKQEGLTDGELQVGITEFLSKYCKDNTVFINNGAKFASHYMDKHGLSLGNTNDNTIDLTQVERSLKGGGSAWTADISVFARNYAADTGKTIKTFDALTKALCMGEMVSKAIGIGLSQTSEKYLENAVKEATQKQDKDYVMSLSRASTLNWIPAARRDFNTASYHFNSLEYVNFGNDRRYVDIDKMFEVNNNFEITLEGEKEPIKTWKELEAKIKALNSEISPELLEKIHEKYEEIKCKSDLMKIRDELNDLDISASSKADYEYWIGNVRKAFIKAVENGNYEVINLTNKQKALRVLELNRDHIFGVIEIGEGKVPISEDATIDVYMENGMSNNPVYSMDITFGDLDRLNKALVIALTEKEARAKKEQNTKSKIDDFICHKLAEIDISDITNEGDWEQDLGMRIELTPSPQLGKELLEYYGANINIDEIIITHGEEIGTKVMLSGIGTNGNTFLTDFNDLSEKNKKAIDKLYQQFEHVYTLQTVPQKPLGFEKSQENEEINRLLSEGAQLKNQLEEIKEQAKQAKEQANNLRIAAENKLNWVKDEFDEKLNVLLTNIDNLIGINNRIQAHTGIGFYIDKDTPDIHFYPIFVKGTNGYVYAGDPEYGGMKASSYLSNERGYGFKEFANILKYWDKTATETYKNVNDALKAEIEMATKSIERDENLIEEYDEYDFD